MSAADRDWVAIKDYQKFVDPPTSNSSGNDAKERYLCTRLVVMSDTHGLHRSLYLPAGDVLIHAGDLTQSGELRILEDLAQCFDSVKDRYSSIVCIAGNHDLTLHRPCYDEIWPRFHVCKEDANACIDAIKKCSAVYLEDSSCTVSGDLRIYGSPWTPYFHHWAFNFPPDDQGVAARAKWNQIPEDIDILITHGPPLGRCDLSVTGRAGCRQLLEQVQQRTPPPRVHLFGHIHEARGSSFDGKTLYVNASNLDLHSGRVVHPCYVIDVPHDRSQPARMVEPDCKQLTSLHDLVQWLDTHGYGEIAAVLRKSVACDIPLGNELLCAEAEERLVNALGVHQEDRPAKQKLHEALQALYADSFSF